MQGGIVPSYAFIIRELFPAREAGFRVSITISATMAGMALGGWLSGAIYDAPGSYQDAIITGVAWTICKAAIPVSTDERRSGKAGVSTFRSRLSAFHYIKNT